MFEGQAVSEHTKRKLHDINNEVNALVKSINHNMTKDDIIAKNNACMDVMHRLRCMKIDHMHNHELAKQIADIYDRVIFKAMMKLGIVELDRLRDVKKDV